MSVDFFCKFNRFFSANFKHYSENFKNFYIYVQNAYIFQQMEQKNLLHLQKKSDDITFVNLTDYFPFR